MTDGELATTDAATPQARLVLYYEDRCGYCRDVLRALEPLDLNVELRDVANDPAARAELVAARGRARVPMLYIDGGGPARSDAHDADRAKRWLPESLDIIRELRSLAGVTNRVPPWIDRVSQLSRPLGLGMMIGSIFVEGVASSWLMGCGLAVFMLVFVRRLFV